MDFSKFNLQYQNEVPIPIGKYVVVEHCNNISKKKSSWKIKVKGKVRCLL